MALFAGLLLDLSNIPVWLRWLDVLSLIKYGYQVLMINQYYDTTLSCAGSLLCKWPTGDDVMEYVGTEPAQLGRNLGIIVVLLLAFRIIAYVLIYIKTSKRAI